MGMIASNAAVSAFEKSAEWDHALQLCAILTQNQFAGNAITFDAAISACEKAASWEQASAFICWVETNMIIRNAAICACEKAREWDKALHLCGVMVWLTLRRNSTHLLAALPLVPVLPATSGREP